MNNEHSNIACMIGKSSKTCNLVLLEDAGAICLRFNRNDTDVSSMSFQCTEIRIEMIKKT